MPVVHAATLRVNTKSLKCRGWGSLGFKAVQGSRPSRPAPRTNATATTATTAAPPTVAPTTSTSTINHNDTDNTQRLTCFHSTQRQPTLISNQQTTTTPHDKPPRTLDLLQPRGMRRPILPHQNLLAGRQQRFLVPDRHRVKLQGLDRVREVGAPIVRHKPELERPLRMEPRGLEGRFQLLTKTTLARPSFTIISQTTSN